jgi:hypothetical protein
VCLEDSFSFFLYFLDKKGGQQGSNGKYVAWENQQTSQKQND